MKHLLLLLSLLLTCSTALSGNIYFKHLGMSDGLSQISVLSICQDELGRMWFGTLEGLNCYDGGRMTVYKPSITHDNLFEGNEIGNLVSDQEGSLFFLADRNLVRYDLRQDRFVSYNLRPKSLCVQQHTVWAAINDSIFRWNRQTEQMEFAYAMPGHSQITCLYVDPNHTFWVGTYSGLYRLDRLSEGDKPVCVIPKINVLSLFRDSRQRLWVATYRKGMYQVEYGVGQPFEVEDDFHLFNDDVRCFAEDQLGNIWVGTFQGLHCIDPQGNVTCYRKGNRPGQLQHASVFSLYHDQQGTIWVGTFYGGVHFFNMQADIFHHDGEAFGTENGLSFPYVGHIVEDKRGDLWICTEGGGLNHLDRRTGRFEHYLMDGRGSATNFYNLKCITYEPESDRLYIGTHKQGYLCFDIATRRVLYHSREAGDSWSQIERYNGRIYMLSKGIYVKDEHSETLRRLYPDIPEANAEGTDFVIDSHEYLWISRLKDLIRINMRNPEDVRIYQYGERGLGEYWIHKMLVTSDGTLFLGTAGDGVYYYDRVKDEFVPCPGVDVAYCYNMTITPRGYLAIANEGGLLIVHPHSGERAMIDVQSQLHLSAINEGCGLLVTSDGETYMGGVDGMSHFRNSDLRHASPAYNLYFSSLVVNNKPVRVGASNNILKSALPFAGRISLRHHENNLTITFSSNNYVHNSGRKVYEYKLEGFNKDWAATYGTTLVYTNLSPGRYKLIVREQQQASGQVPEAIELPIVIHCPWWETWWAVLIYLVVLSVVAWIVFTNWYARIQLRASLEKEKMEKEKNEELIQAKLQFFANVSHEFRTPLTIIISQLEALLQGEGLSPYLRGRLQKIYKNSFLFRELISELLDFRKMGRGKLTLHVCRMNLIPYLEQIYQDFLDQAQLQEVHFTFTPEVDVLWGWYDGRQLRKVFSNLLSNAFKHTPAGGKVDIRITAADSVAKICVIDSGEGIPEADLPYIFDRFYQADSHITSAGSGIGLALSKGIVELHHGRIDVQSAVGYGSIFTVELPMQNLFADDTYVTFVQPGTHDSQVVPYPVAPVTAAGDEAQADEAALPSEIMAASEVPGERDSILLVEDSEDLLQILTTLLSTTYRVSIAMNGREGLKKALEEQPDIIVSDIMMPEMDGIEMCRRIKSSIDLCHIPVILLTALTSEVKKLEGLKCGADDYIEKPFNNRMLLWRITNLLRNRKLLKQKFGRELSANVPQEQAGKEMEAISLSSLDAAFLSRLEATTREHLVNSDFDVNLLAKEMGMSRSSLYNKLRALSSISPNEYILNIRLKYAAELLRNEPETQITDIALRSGFTTLRYFRHCFKTTFNQTPQEYRSAGMESKEE